ncbi:hypothetical protein MRB53_040722 [Persea americana]|nr:hypothetical protein MRB53_040722 [Persea americana]
MRHTLRRKAPPQQETNSPTYPVNGTVNGSLGTSTDVNGSYTGNTPSPVEKEYDDAQLEKDGGLDDSPIKVLTLRVASMLLIVSLGGMIFGKHQ